MQYVKILKIIILSTIVCLINSIHVENIRFSSAGVIPRVLINNKSYLVLGKETQGIKTGKFDCFCGSRENTETPWQTASREFYEESVGALGNLEYYQNLKFNIKAKIVFFRPNSKIAIDYIVDLNKKQFETLVINFYKNLKKPKLDIVFKEKSQLALFEEKEVINMIKKSTNYQNFKLNALILDPIFKIHNSQVQIDSFLPELLKEYYKNNKINFSTARDFN